ncbi:NUDIX domain-containing protein [Actinacidiphila rubida]|uniref:8-oxo-dGTP pyrophosphatase MutT, NUDIX family n=1 Tax=Actinacidiphila rubida TaxID=310780 RepID=A0A1H8GF60_9ACTN|nr:NUDIX hydrolase [Actinacidiphila rubida]SEN42440.1 8-oxo-dGTP pyrophosphatase MutT, NUDIX family [Actinacidiphila rubida]
MPPDSPPSATARPVVKRTARAIILDGDHLVLIKRTKPGIAPYWVTPGGGVEDEDPNVLAALHREIDEELGGKITDAVPAFVDTIEHIADDGSHGVKVQYFFVCRLESMDPARRHGPEVDEPRGDYEVVRVPFSRMGLASVDIVPLTLRHYLDANIEGVLGLLGPDLG